MAYPQPEEQRYIALSAKEGQVFAQTVSSDTTHHFVAIDGLHQTLEVEQGEIDPEIEVQQVVNLEGSRQSLSGGALINHLQSEIDGAPSLNPHADEYNVPLFNEAYYDGIAKKAEDANAKLEAQLNPKKPKATPQSIPTYIALNPSSGYSSVEEAQITWPQIMPHAAAPQEIAVPARMNHEAPTIIEQDPQVQPTIAYTPQDGNGFIGRSAQEEF